MKNRVTAGFWGVFLLLTSLITLTVIPLNANSAETQPSKKISGEIMVLAASSLNDSFTKIGEKFESEHNDVKVRFSFGASSQIRQQLEEEVGGDVVATADTKTMALLNQSSLVAKKSIIFAKNTFAIVVKNKNPSKIKTLADLGNDKQKIVLCSPGVPCGVYANQILRRAKVSISHPILSSDAASAVSLVALGEADAALIYRTEAISNSRLKGIEIPKSENITAQYPAAVIKNSSNKTAAREFVKVLNEPKAQKILSKYGFLPKAKL